MSRVFMLVGLGLALAFASGCGGGDGPATVSAPRINISLLDGPAPEYTAIHLPILRVEIHTSTGNESSGWTVLGTPNRTVNLLALRGGVVDELVKGASLQEGRYQQMRLVLGPGASVTLKEGITAALEVPSSLTSGIKIPLSFTVMPGTTKDIFIDFDGARSIQLRETGPSVRYILRPVIRAVDKAVTGSISGTLSGPKGPLAQALVLAQGFDAQGRPELLRVVSSGADGKYSLDLLPLDRPLHAVTLPNTFMPQASPAITLTQALPTATWSATLAAATATGTLAGTVTPAPGSDQTDAAELITTVNNLSLLVATTNSLTGSGGATFSFPSLPVSTYRVQVRRTTLNGDGTRSAILSPLSNPITLQAGQTSTLTVTVP